MFRSVRHWWTGGRGKVTARLFVFELFVVILGVLIAQGLAEWAQDRAAIKRMEESRAAVFDQISIAAVAGDGWKRASSCLDRRMTAIMRLAGEGRPIPPELLRRPRFRTAVVALPDSADLLLMGDRHGVDEHALVVLTESSAASLSDRVKILASAWQGLALVDAVNGPVTGADRIEARKAAAGIKLQLVGIDINAGSLVKNAKRLGVYGRAEPEFRPIHDCDEMWRANATDIDLPGTPR